jgi:tetrapyrrole methylase family protein/MazG family protein
MSRLRAKNGCPWDREQTPESLRQWTLEETYELLEAVEDGVAEDICGELGDLLLQIVFFAQIFREKGDFDITDVCDGISDKLIRRHPHVFGKTKVKNSDEVTTNWALIKMQEKPGARKSILDGVPRKMPALHEAFRLTEKAAQVGFDWKKYAHVVDKLMEELGELKQAIKSRKKNEIEHETGDLLFMAANIARFIGENPEMALRKANRRFKDRFHYIEAALKKMGKKPEDSTLEEMDRLWDESKVFLKKSRRKK